MATNFRESAPKRTYTKHHTIYREYKSALRDDFNARCGYTDCPDFWFGGRNNFHIDHFIPWKKYQSSNPQLKTDYANLVYACSYVNILKSEDEGNYLDPCQVDYNEHFFRSDDGAIRANPQSEKAVYMQKKLKLYLARYGVIWKLEQLEKKIESIHEKISHLPKGEKNREALLELSHELSVEFFRYKKYLAASQ